MVAYESGMRNFLLGRLSFSAHFLIIGAKIMTIGVLFKNAEIPAIGTVSLNISLGIGALFFGSITVAIFESAPVCLKPSLTRNKMPTVSMPLFEKPAIASSAVRMSVTIKTT